MEYRVIRNRKVVYLCMLLSILASGFAFGQEQTELPQESTKPQTELRVIKLDLHTPDMESIVLLGDPEKIELGVKICSAPDVGGLSISKDESSLEIDSVAFAPQWLSIKYVKQDAGCDQQTSEILLYPSNLSEWGDAKQSVTLWFDSNVLELTGSDLEKYQLVSVMDGMIVGTSICMQNKICTHEVAKNVLQELADESVNAGVLLWPKEVPLSTGKRFPAVVSPKGQLQDWRAFLIPIGDIVFTKPLVAASRLDTLEERQLISSRFVKAFKKVTCDKAECRLTEQGVLFFHIDLAASSVKLRYYLKPRYFRKIGSKLVTAETVVLKLERCSIRIPKEVPLLAGIENHRYYIKIPRECTSADSGELLIKTKPPVRAFVRTELETSDQNARLFQVSFERVPRGTDRISLSIFERLGYLRRLGNVKIPIVSSYAPTQIRFDVPGVGVVDHLPSNVWANLYFGTNRPEWFENFFVEARPGFYRISRVEKGWTVMAEQGVTGNVPLRFAYCPKRILSFVHATEDKPKPPALATFDTEAAYAVRSINMPLSLLDGDNKFFQVICGLRGKETEIKIGSLARIPYEERDSCRIVFSRDKVSNEAGVQRLRVQAGGFNQILLLSHGTGTLTVAIPVGEKKEYDRLTAVISHEMLSGHYTFQSRQSLGGEARYRILLTDSWWRIGATTALPTGLFRFGAGDSEGSIPLSAGVLTRLNYIKRNGRDFPFGLEVGLFGTNLSGQPDFSMVIGVGLSIPVLNTNTSLQASFNIHAWIEYAPTRAAREGHPIAFLFGPSFSVGRLSTTF